MLAYKRVQVDYRSIWRGSCKRMASPLFILLISSSINIVSAGASINHKNDMVVKGEFSKYLIKVSQETKVYDFDFKEQSLSMALDHLHQKTNLYFSYPTSLTHGIKSRALIGRYTAKQALSSLLEGTGISYQFVGKGTASLQVAQAGDGTQLDTIVVEGGADKDASSGNGFQGTPDWVYETPDSVSVISREAIQNSPVRNAGDLLDSAAGVYSNKSEAQNPGISVNIRGLQDQDRVATMIDGARQTFQKNGHGATQRTYVDSAFIRQVDIEKSSTSGVGSGGSLGGSVNFRTIIADDLIEEGKQWGAEFKAATGTNAFDFDGSGSVAYRIFDNFFILGGISHKKIGAYETGQKGELPEFRQNTTYTGDTLLFTGEEVYSSLLKAELKINNDTNLTVGWVRYDSNFSTGSYNYLLGDNGDLKETEQAVINDTYTAALDWNPENNLIDFEARAYFNRTSNDETSAGSTATGLPDNIGTSIYQMDTYGGSLQNTSRIDSSLGALTLNFGGEGFHDKGESKLNGGQYIIFDIPTNSYIDYSDVLSGGTPSGERTVASGFISAKLEHQEWLTVEGGMRYDWYNISGDTVIFSGAKKIGHPNSNCTFWIGTICLNWGTPAYTEYVSPVPYNVNVDNSGDAFLPTLMIAVKPTDFLQPFVKYSKSFRPPTVMESFINGGHAGQTISGYAPNPNLRPERAVTWELGVNISQNGLFTNDDKFRLKAVRFKREIEDYISFGQIRNAQNSELYSTSINLNGLTIMKGLEVEANYDAGFFYIGGALTLIKTDFANTYTNPVGGSGSINDGTGPAVIFEQPEMRVTIDAGVRLFDKKLTLGMRMNDVGATEPKNGELGLLNNQIDGYRVFDLYGSYAFDDKTKLNFAVTNLKDLAYAPATGAAYYAAPGRTFTVSLNAKF